MWIGVGSKTSPWMGEAVSIAKSDANSSKGVKPGDIPAGSTMENKLGPFLGLFFISKMQTVKIEQVNSQGYCWRGAGLPVNDMDLTYRNDHLSLKWKPEDSSGRLQSTKWERHYRWSCQILLVLTRYIDGALAGWCFTEVIRSGIIERVLFSAHNPKVFHYWNKLPNQPLNRCLGS